MALVMGSVKKSTSFLTGGKRGPQGPQTLSVEVPEPSGVEVAGAAQVAEAAQVANVPRVRSTKFFDRNGQAKTYIGSFRWKVFQTFENPAFSNLAKLISIVVMATILVSTVTFIFESEACEPTSFLPANPTLKVFLVIEVISVTIFSMCAQG
tara:strand:- start:87 stop:542 length:456 start_codon:yes stop_codon:yes gene_type:complete